MHWRFTDSIDYFEPWRRIEGRKAVSYEEGTLGERLGRPGVLPESLLLASCVHLARWLVMASSGFASAAVLGGVEELSLASEARLGEVLTLCAEVVHRTDDSLTASITATSGERLLADGIITLRIVPMAGRFAPDEMEGMWREIYAKT